ncbi:MAG: C40 family peptidase [Candidatus Aminicenantes bacterium RBG_16_66_30]
MKGLGRRGGAAVLVIALSWSPGCRTGVRTAPRPAPAVPAAIGSPAVEPPATRAAQATDNAALARMGYTVQVGAFSVLDNARALAATLIAAGLDAFYFPSGSGLFKVRFGNYPSRDEALDAARKLKAEGRIAEYFIVGPADYAVTLSRVPRRPVNAPPPSAITLRERLVETAESFIGVDYAWGGTSTRSGFDCSGLVQAVYQLNGLAMPRSVRDQYLAGAAVARDNLMKGDLVFFAAEPGGPLSHVGIYIGDGVFIHAPGSGKNVRRESLGGSWFQTHFSGARAYLDERLTAVR